MIIKFNNDIQLECINLNYIPNASNPYIKILANVQDFSVIKNVLSNADFSKIETYTSENGNLTGTYNGFTEYDFSTTALSNFTLDVTITLKQKSLQEKVDLIEQTASDTISRVDALEKASEVDTENMSLEEYKVYKQDLNNQALAEFLNKSSVTYKNKEYGVSEKDQNEMAMNLIVYQLYQSMSLPSILEWHAKKEQCSTFTPEEYQELIIKVKTFVYPYVQYCQNIKAQIFGCETKESVAAITFDYDSYVPEVAK